MTGQAPSVYAKVYVEITNICNMHCSFCHGHSRPLQRMEPAAFSHILEQLEGKTSYLYYHLMGEPLTHPLLPDFLRMAADKGFRSVITTNGTLLSQHGDAILAAGVHKVSVSLHSFEDGDVDSFIRYLQGVTDFAKKASAQGVIVVLRLWNQGCDGGRNAEIIRFLQQQLPGEWAENTKGIRIRPKLHLEWGERFGWPDANAPIQGEQFSCYGLKDHFGILCDGSVVPCCLDSEGSITLGNVMKQPLSQILDSPRAQSMRKGFACRRAAEELCRRCAYAQRFV